MDPPCHHILLDAALKNRVGPHYFVLKAIVMSGAGSIHTNQILYHGARRFPKDTIPAHVAKDLVLDMRALDEQPR